VSREVAVWVEGEARGGLVKLRRGGRGGRARLTPARPLWGGGLCCVGRRVSGERKGRGGLPNIARDGCSVRGANLGESRAARSAEGEDGRSGKRPPRPVGDAAASLFRVLK
jgi:hypothetical protein